jgi:hypothetical protein
LIFFVPTKDSGVEKFVMAEVTVVESLSLLLSVGGIVGGCRMSEVVGG